MKDAKQHKSLEANLTNGVDLEAPCLREESSTSTVLWTKSKMAEIRLRHLGPATNAKEAVQWFTSATWLH